MLFVHIAYREEGARGIVSAFEERNQVYQGKCNQTAIFFDTSASIFRAF